MISGGRDMCNHDALGEHSLSISKFIPNVDTFIGSMYSAKACALVRSLQVDAVRLYGTMMEGPACWRPSSSHQFTFPKPPLSSPINVLLCQHTVSPPSPDSCEHYGQLA